MYTLSGVGDISGCKRTAILEKFRPIGFGTLDENVGYYEIAGNSDTETPLLGVKGYPRLTLLGSIHLPLLFPSPNTTDMRSRSLPRKRPTARNRSGFTLLELLLVLAILVVIGGIALPNFLGAGQEAKANATKVQLNSLKQSIDLFKVHE